MTATVMNLRKLTQHTRRIGEGVAVSPNVISE